MLGWRPSSPWLLVPTSRAFLPFLTSSWIPPRASSVQVLRLTSPRFPLLSVSRRSLLIPVSLPLLLLRLPPPRLLPLRRPRRRSLTTTRLSVPVGCSAATRLPLRRSPRLTRRSCWAPSPSER
eukprot:XP_001705793.1 Hypothetical protein GL50803_20168 [Giardia lamblia ATCC 50803]